MEVVMGCNSSGKERLFKTLRHEPVCKAVWVPFAGVHAGKLKGFSAREVLTDTDKLVESLLEVQRLYDPDGMPVVFDLQIEAEILGCSLLWSEDTPPSVATHPLATLKTLPTHLPEPNEGRLPLVLEAMRHVKAEIGDETALYGLVTGPFTLASHLRGTDIFYDTADDPAYLQSLIDYCVQVANRMCELYIQAGVDVIAIVDPVTSQISPRVFSRYLERGFTDIFEHIRQLGAYSAFFVCGDASKNIEKMCQTKPDCIAVDENVDIAFARQITQAHNITLQGNIPLTTCMLLGNQQDNAKFALDLLDLVGDEGNFIVSPGCDMPYDTPPDNVIATLQALRDPHTARLILANYHAADLDLDAVQVPDYAHLERPLMEVFTLDSASCAACGYMLSAAQRAADSLQGQVDMLEFKITKPENVARMHKMGIKNLPCILINGELKFSSLIPSQKELVAAIKSAGNP